MRESAMKKRAHPKVYPNLQLPEWFQKCGIKICLSCFLYRCFSSSDKPDHKSVKTLLISNDLISGLSFFTCDLFSRQNLTYGKGCFCGNCFLSFKCLHFSIDLIEILSCTSQFNLCFMIFNQCSVYLLSSIINFFIDIGRHCNRCEGG